MRFAILPLVIRRESQFVSAGDDVLIRCRSSWMRNFGPNDAAQDTPDRPTASLFFVAVVPMECLTSSKTHPQNDLQQLHGFPVMVLPITSRLNPAGSSSPGSCVLSPWSQSRRINIVGLALFLFLDSSPTDRSSSSSASLHRFTKNG
jgi:hypothetical protein